MEGWGLALFYYNIFVLFYFVSLNGLYLILNMVAYVNLRRYNLSKKLFSEEQIFRSEFYKPISFLVPGYNEESTIVDTIRSVLALRYPEYEIIAINDGSTDKTMDMLKEAFELKVSAKDYKYDIECEKIRYIYRSVKHPNLVVIDKENGGKSDALNAGINVSRFPIFCNTDADSVLDDGALLRMVDPFVKDWRVIACGGTIRIANDCEIRDGQVTKVNLPKNPWARFQLVEYLRAFLFGRVGWSALNGVMILSGAFSVFRRSAVIEAGGYSKKTVGEDMDMVLRVQKAMNDKGRPYRVVFLPDPVCWTQVPEDRKSLSGQRRRWQRGLCESLFMNTEMFFNPRYKSTGIISYPFHFFFEFLGPVIELSGYIIFILSLFLGILNPPFIILFLTAAILLGVMLSVSSIFFEVAFFRDYYRFKDIMILFLYAILENFGYRQLHSWWRIRGIFDFAMRKKGGWGTVARKKFNPKE